MATAFSLPPLVLLLLLLVVALPLSSAAIRPPPQVGSELVWAQCGVLNKAADTFLQIGCDDQQCKDVFPGTNCAATDNPVDDHCAASLGRSCCGYEETFYGGGGTKGNLASETFSFDGTPVPALVFGCSDSDTVLNDLDSRASGFPGFSMAPLSLVSQLQISSFSYFIALPDDPNKDKSFVSWGVETPNNNKGGHTHSTPLLVPTANQNAHWYYVKLTGVQVDGQLLSDIPAGTFDVKTDGGGVFLSTTLPVTYLEKDAYHVLRRELVSKMQSKGVSPTNPADEDHLCFDTQAFADKEVPKLALVFDGAVMELKVQNYFFTLDSGVTCLTILPSTGGSVLGSMLQTGRTMTYDLQLQDGAGGGMLTFDTFETAAAAPAPAKVHIMIMATLLLCWVLL
ncbi:hypothetical protein ZWY2020_047585 [Hordeum vulgare]|nr:hypothetical protein ZWY2020_047585 [Hordeum vulgare]